VIFGGFKFIVAVTQRFPHSNFSPIIFSPIQSSHSEHAPNPQQPTNTAHEGADKVDFELIFGATPDCNLILRADNEFTIVAANNAYIQLLKYSREELIGQSVFTAFPADPKDPTSCVSLDRLRQSFQTVAATGVPHSMGLLKYNLRVSGQLDFQQRFWSIVNTPVWNAQRTSILYIVNRVQDMTEYFHAIKQSQSQDSSQSHSQIRDEFPLSFLERSHVEEAHMLRQSNELQEASNLLRGIIDSAADLIIAVDTNMNITCSNKAMRAHIDALFGTQLTVGTSVLAMVRRFPEAAKRAEDWWQRALKGETFIIHQESGFQAGRCWELRFTPICDYAGRIVGACHIGRDVTDRTRLEQTLFAAKVEAETANVAKTKFFANISHEFRTPLTLILGPVEDSLSDQEGRLSEAQLERQLLIRHNALRLLKLVNSLLDFSRLEATSLQPVIEPTDLGSITQLLCKEFRSTIEKAGLTFIVDTPSFAEPVFVDKEMWEKIVFNLLSNAFKFTLQGGIWVKMTKQSKCVELSVTDTGVGISTDSLKFVFERFNRVEGSLGRSFEGSGIGLALVKELAQQLGGNVRVESELGKGSVFTVWIPLGHKHVPPEQIGAVREGYHLGAIGAAYATEASGWEVRTHDVTRSNAMDQHQPIVITNPIPPSPASSSSSGTSSNASSHRILVVDDNADMRAYVAKVLMTQRDWIAELAENGQRALELIHSDNPHRFNVILTDVMMPVMNGQELLIALRADPRTRTIPVIMLSARSDEDDLIRGLQLGAEDYICKPFAAKELIARVNSHIELGLMRWHLEDLVAERTTELQNAHARLQQEITARYEAQVAVEEARTRAAETHRQQLENLVDTICHEIRNPLNGIFGGVDTIKSALLSLWSLTNGSLDLTKVQGVFQEMHEALSVIDECATHQKSLVDDVLDLSTIQACAVSLNNQPFSPKVAVDNAVKIFRQEIAKKQLQLTVECSEDDAATMVVGDARRCTQIIINLLGNAVKFTQTGGITIRIKINFHSTEATSLSRVNADASNTEVESNGVRLKNLVNVQVSVKDTGVGIALADQAKLFLRFSQGSRRVGDQYQGSGLGLAISKQLAELMNGTIWLESEMGNGATFYVSLNLPIARSSFDSDERSRSPSTSPPLTLRGIGTLDSLCVLIVEDNLTNQRLLTRMLQKCGAKSMVANNGAEALDLNKNNHFDAIFMDVQMPVMGGIEATRAIRTREKGLQLPPVPIIGLSADARPEHKDIATTSGMNDYVTKPYQREAILQKLTQWTSLKC
jgi:signal transduction histidine kinase